MAGPKIKGARRRGRVTTTAPALIQQVKPGALREPGPTGGGDQLVFGRGPYRDAHPGLWAGGSTVLFNTGLSSAMREIIPYRDKAVANAREADRNYNFIHAGINKRAVNTVGAQLRLQYLPNWDALGIDGDSDEAIEFVQQMENHFSLWGEDARLLCDAQRQGQFGALMLLAAREVMGTEGETFVLSRYDEERMVRYRGDYATFIEVISCDRLSTPSDYVEGRGPRIVAGKELDEYGAAVAYHIENAHPSDRAGERKWTRVVRETEWGRPVGIHYFFRSRAGMQRNMPAIIQSLRSIKMLFEQYDQSKIERAVLETLISIYIKSPDTSEDMLQKLSTTAPTGGMNPLAELWDKRFGLYDDLKLQANGVRLPVLAPGDEIKMETASSAATEDDSFRATFMRGMAVQLNLTYEQFSGDYSDTTFSSARAALIDLWRLITVDRILFTQHTALQIFAGFVEEMWLRGDEVGFVWPASFPNFYDAMNAYTQAEFRGPGMGWVDPDKDQKAAAGRTEQGISSPTAEAAMQGNDFRDNIDQISRDHAYARKKKVFIPGMPEYVAMQNPVPPPAADSGDDEPGETENKDPANEDEARAAEERRQENRR